MNLNVDWINNHKAERYCIRIESGTAKSNYVEISLIYALISMGGKLEQNIVLPAWAGKKWENIKPKSLVDKIKFWLDKTLPT